MLIQIHKVDIPSKPIHLQIVISLLEFKSYLATGYSERKLPKLELLGIFAKHQRERGKKVLLGGKKWTPPSRLSLPQVSFLGSMDHESSCCLWSWMQQASQRDGALNWVEWWSVKRQDPSFALRGRNYLNIDKDGQRDVKTGFMRQQ